MGKKHFIAIAAAIKAHDAQYPQKPFELEHLAALMQVYKAENAAFNVAKFLAAAKPEQYAVKKGK